MANINLSAAWVEFPLTRSKTTYAAIKELDLKVASGDRLGILGPNGSGKTTLLRLIIGTYPPTRGSRDISGAIGPMLDLQAGIRGKITAAGERVTTLALADGIKVIEADKIVSGSPKDYPRHQGLHC